MDRIKEMKKKEIIHEYIISKLGKIHWDGNDAFEVINKQGVKLVLCPNTGRDRQIPSQIIVDEIYVPPRLRRKGRATKAMRALCQLADKYQFDLLGGPIGFSNTPWRDKYVEWVLSFGFERDQSQHVQCDDLNAFYVRRLSHTKNRTISCFINVP